MSFGTGVSIVEYDGAGFTTVITGATAAQADANFSVHNTNATLTAFDNSTLLASLAKVIFTGQWATITSIEGTTLGVYLVPQDVDGTVGHDSESPTLTVQNGAIFVGSLRVSTGVAATDMYLQTVIPLLGFEKFKVVIKNNSGQSISTGFTVKIKPLGYNVS